MWFNDREFTECFSEARRRRGSESVQKFEELEALKLPTKKNHEPASRLIVEFAVSNHNVIRQQELRKKNKEKAKLEKPVVKQNTFDLKEGRKSQKRFQKAGKKIMRKRIKN